MTFEDRTGSAHLARAHASGRRRCLRTLLVATAAVLAFLPAGGARAADVGANDDTPKFGVDGGAALFAQMTAAGLRQTVLTVRWRPRAPLEIPSRDALDRAVTAATAHGLAVVLAAYPYPPSQLESGLGRPKAFAAWLKALAAAYPAVKHFVLLNEPNQPAFLRPQFDARGANVSAARAGALLAAGYDALKAVDPGITVVGLGLSPRGNDRPDARSNVSTSPVRFLTALGAWYRASGRTRPLMDGLSLHPYPNVATDPIDRGYPWPNAGFPDLARVKQALWDAFAGTSQPTTLRGLKLYLDEVGWQVDTADRPGYRGAENVPVTTEAAQGSIYRELVLRAACDPDVAQLNVFGFYDDAERTGFQAALHRVDGTPRPAAAAVAEAIASASCPRVPDRWRPETGVAGATAPAVGLTRGGVAIVLSAAEGAVATACLLRGVVSATSARRILRSGPAGSGCTTAVVRPNRAVRLAVSVPARARHTVAVRIAAEANPSRATAYAFSGARLTGEHTFVYDRTHVRIPSHHTSSPPRPARPRPVGALRPELGRCRH